MQNKLKYILFAALAAIIALYFYNKYKNAPTINFSKLELFTAEGNPVNWNDFKGKKLVVSFGASWCVNCLDELKLINSVKEKNLSDVEIIIISDEAIEKVQAFKNKKGYPFTFLK